ncbi:DMT family transporter [Phreatobacter stygius]|uniref:DMT family transporter n=1 Tax=Phreatobacter stygius TaxID=1940610 RepID=A0A4D7AZQ5_9HYPH|nr:DMT family transporter [Phreatobacter stygius]QCI64825.1 DMT family transporter [Phreatobacter stygius]
MPSRAVGITAALAGAVAYGVNIVFARMATQQGVSAADLVFLRVFLMMGAVAATLALAGGSLKVETRDRPLLILVGITSGCLGLAYFFAVSFVPIGIAAVIFYTFPLLILIASPFIDGERFTLQRLGVFALAFGGLAIALGPTLGGIDMRGVLLAALASVLAASQFFAAARAGARISPAALLFWSHVVIMPIAGLVALANGLGQLSALGGAWFAATMTMLGYLVGFAFQMLSARNAPPALVGLVFCLEPVVAIVTANFVLGETLSAPQMVGSLLVLTALVASSLAELRREPKPA